MRPKMKSGDYIFGISPSEPKQSRTSRPPRRIVFTAQIEERLTFAEAFNRFPDLHGPGGPIHVRPIKGTGSFPTSSYEHIPGSMHEYKKKWQRDLATHKRDAFFVCSKRDDWFGRWLGKYGPEIDEKILKFLKACSVHGLTGMLNKKNIDATLSCPIRHRGPNDFLCTGLHLETNQTEVLLELIGDRITAKPSDLDRLPLPKPGAEHSGVIGCGKSSQTCG